MKKKITLILGFFSVVPLSIFFLVLYSLFIIHENSQSSRYLKMSLFGTNVEYSALPEVTQQTLATLEIKDARVAVLEEFFTRYNSPLLAHAQKIVSEADHHELDYRLLPAIAMKESTLCKRIPENSYNCWGFGIYGDKVTRFDSYNQAIETISRTLKKKYIDQGLTDPEAIMTKYTPSSNGSWADTVNLIMNRIHSSL